MRFKTGLLVGFGAGYYYGAKAGHERFQQLEGMLAKVRENEAVETAAEKAKAVLDLSVERARDLIDSRHEPEPVVVIPPDPTLN